MTNQRNIRVFVYGSLMQGFGNHPLLAQADFLGAASTLPGFTLVNLGAFPGMHHDSKSGGVVTGELYAVNAVELSDLDGLEGHPDFYRRQLITVGDEPTFTYILPHGGWGTNGAIPSGDWHDVPRPVYRNTWRAATVEADEDSDDDARYCAACGSDEPYAACNGAVYCGPCLTDDGDFDEIFEANCDLCGSAEDLETMHEHSTMLVCDYCDERLRGA